MAASNISIFVVKCFRYVLHLPTKSDHEFHTTPFIWSDLMLSYYHSQESYIITPFPTEHYNALLHIWNPLLRIVSFDIRISFDLCVICHTMRPRYDTRGAYCCLLSSFSLFSCLSLFGDYLDYFELKSDRVNQNIAKGTTDPRIEFILTKWLLKSYHEFKHLSWSHFIIRISTKHQLKISTKHQHLH